MSLIFAFNVSNLGLHSKPRSERNLRGILRSVEGADPRVYVSVEGSPCIPVQYIRSMDGSQALPPRM